MPYCQNCGNPIAEPDTGEAEAAGQLADGLADATESQSTAEVEIARIQADRDITLAKIERGIVADVTEAEVTEDAVKADLLDEILTPPEAEAEPEVVIAEAEAEAEPDTAPPDTVESSVPEPSSSRGSANVWW